jgi:excinuclease UvrABC helicase subunit UvrB
LEEDMKVAARNLQFEKAIVLREQVKELKRKTRNEK